MKSALSRPRSPFARSTIGVLAAAVVATLVMRDNTIA